MSAILMSGVPIAESMLAEIRKEAELLISKGITPGIGTILVGDNPDCRHYVNNKHKMCKEIGIKSFHVDIPDSAEQEVLLSAIDDFNHNPEIDAFLLQNPVPKKI